MVGMPWEKDNYTHLGKSPLVGGLEHGWIMTFHSVGNVIGPQLTFTPSFFRGVVDQSQTRGFLEGLETTETGSISC